MRFKIFFPIIFGVYCHELLWVKTTFPLNPPCTLPMPNLIMLVQHKFIINSHVWLVFWIRHSSWNWFTKNGKFILLNIYLEVVTWNFVKQYEGSLHRLREPTLSYEVTQSEVLTLHSAEYFICPFFTSISGKFERHFNIIINSKSVSLWILPVFFFPKPKTAV